MSGKSEKSGGGTDEPPSYEDTMRQDAAASRARDAECGYTHTPRANSKKGFPGGQKLTYTNSRKGA